MSVIAADLTARLNALVGEGNVLTGAAAAPFATDVYRTMAAPRAVVRPGSVDELQAVIGLAAQDNARFTVRGGGASYTDGYLAADAQDFIIDISRLTGIEIDEYGGKVTVEAGVTWAGLAEALAAKGLRTPFKGPFSGFHATIGGSMSQNAISHGSGAHGISAESALSFDVILADGTLLRTGSAAQTGVPFVRHAGPDLTGLFTGDCGVFGVKARVTLPLLRMLPAHRPISFAFPDFASMHEAMRRVALERIEDTHFAIDAALSQGQIARQDRAGGTVAMALSILRSSPSLTSGFTQLLRAGTQARRQIGKSAFMCHYIVEGFDDAETRGKLHRLRQLVSGLGQEIAATVPAVVRGMPFAPFYNTLGPGGERWVPLHGILPHAQAAKFHDALEAFYTERADELKRHGIWYGGMFSTVGTAGFLYEIAIYWPDEQTAYHKSVIPADYLANLPSFRAAPEARAAVEKLKRELVALYDAHGAIHFQLGRAYPYAQRLDDPALQLVRTIKDGLDPGHRLQPGVLGL